MTSKDANQTTPTKWETYNVTVRTHQTNYTDVDYYRSLADMWSDWYLQYFKADYPRLLVRFEDLLYRQEEVVTIVKRCIGMDDERGAGEAKMPFKYFLRQSKYHGSPTEFIDALNKYASHENRHRGLTDDDRAYAASALHPDLMRAFNYTQAPPTAPEEDLYGPFV